MHFVEPKPWNSKYMEYHKGAWRRPVPSVYVTLDTIIPEMPTDILEQPDKEKFEIKIEAMTQRQRAINDELKQKVQQFEQCLKEKTNHIDQRKEENVDKT